LVIALGYWLLLAALFGLSGQLAGAQTDRPLATTVVRIRAQSLTVHLTAGSFRSAPLVVYATGDGGWPGEERLFDRMRPWGLPMAGLSSVDYLDTIDSPNRMVTTAQLAQDLTSVFDEAIRSLKLPPNHPVVLVGFSRGASLAVAAATVPAFAARLQGILALGLAADEVYVLEPGAGDRPLQTYEALSRLGSLKIAVIQSTRDDFVTAAEARRRMGPDTAARRLRSIGAKDHSFGGKLDELGVEMKASVDWLIAR
jgi:pimeloyl-ACP methyl ester carboxylesterase